MGRKGNSGLSSRAGNTASGIQRTFEVDVSKYDGYARTLAAESNKAMAEDDSDQWMMKVNNTENGQSFVRYSLEDNYIAAIGSTSQGSGATKLLSSALKDIRDFGDDRQPVEWLVYSKDAIKYYDHIGLSKYRKRDTYSIPRSDLTKVINKLDRR